MSLFTIRYFAKVDNMFGSSENCVAFLSFKCIHIQISDPIAMDWASGYKNLIFWFHLIPCKQTRSNRKTIKVCY